MTRRANQNAKREGRQMLLFFFFFRVFQKDYFPRQYNLRTENFTINAQSWLVAGSQIFAKRALYGER